MRGHRNKFQKIDYMSIFRAGLPETGGPWHLKKWSQKILVKMLFSSPMTNFGKCTKKINFYIPLNLS